MKNTIYFDAEFAPLLLVNEEQVGSNSIVINIEADSTADQSLLITMDSGTTTSLIVTPGQENSLAIDEDYWSLGGSTFVSLVKGGLTSNSITLIFPETINTDAALEETSNLTYTMTGSNTVTEQIDNLDDRVTALEQGGGGNVVYTSVANPDPTLGNEGDLWVRYHNEYDDKFINSDNEEISVNIPRYESDNDALSYVDTTIRPILRTIKDTGASKLSDIVKQFERECSVVLYQYYFSESVPGGMITSSQFPQLVIDTYTVNNQSLSVIQGTTLITIGGTDVAGRVIGTEAYNNGKYVNVDDFDNALAEDGGNWYVLYRYLYYNTTTKYLNVINGYLDINWYNHTLPSDTLRIIVTNYSINLLDTSFAVIDEVYCKINGKWTLYEGSGEGGTNVEVTQILTSGTEIAQIDLNGDVVSIYAPTPQTISYVQTLASGTNIGTITIDGTATPIYAPPSGSTVTVTTKTSTGTNIADVEVDGTTYQLFAPTSGGGSNVTVTPITTTGTNIANISVDGTTYNLFAPTSGGGSGGHNYSTTEQVVGTWIDGSVLYEKTYTYSFTASSSDYDYNIATLSSEVNTQCIEANALSRDGILFKEVIYPPGGTFYRYVINNNVLGVRVFNSNGCIIKGTVTIKYTKSS